jgi:hypothetical protein
MHCGQSTSPNYRGEPEKTMLLQSTRPSFQDGVVCETKQRIGLDS